MSHINVLVPNDSHAQQQVAYLMKFGWDGVGESSFFLLFFVNGFHFPSQVALNSMVDHRDISTAKSDKGASIKVEKLTSHKDGE
jgi:hypothetical protein